MSSPPSSILPSSKQTWSHSTDSQQALRDALSDPSVTAIEADVVMGYHVHSSTSSSSQEVPIKIPILAHPPDDQSDLSVCQFLQMVISEEKLLLKHIKLDFKEMEPIKPTLGAIEEIGVIGGDDDEKKFIFLNADILLGPGMRSGEIIVDADDFLPLCIDAKKSNGLKNNYALSLGWRVDYRSVKGYTSRDIQNMLDIINRYELTQLSFGIVLPVNDRVLSNDCKPFDSFLEQIPDSQLLVWTGSGEPPISEQKILTIQHHFEEKDTLYRTGFDCKIASPLLSGAIYHNSTLPSSKQTWSHSAVSQQALCDALSDPSVTAIEVDIIMGYHLCSNALSSPQKIPILAHPPDDHSDLSVHQFLQMVISEDKLLLKHVKLDFKEMEPIKATLDAIEQVGVIGGDDDEKKFIFLNADVLLGPGKRSGELIVDADEFLSLCIDAKESNLSFCGAHCRFTLLFMENFVSDFCSSEFEK